MQRMEHSDESQIVSEFFGKHNQYSVEKIFGKFTRNIMISQTDIIFATLCMSKFLDKSTESVWKVAKRV